MREPLFILCPGRSFSSVVCAIIGQHPDAFGLPEVHLFVQPTVSGLLNLDTPVVGLAGASVGLKRAVAELVFQSQTYESIEDATAWIKEHRHLTGAELFRKLCDLAGDALVVEKSPTNSHPDRVPAIYRQFPNAKYLHISRHPRSTCRSQRKAYQNRPSHRGLSHFDHEAHWLTHHRSILELSTRLGPGQYMFMHGEWFFEDPKSWLIQICDWLGLSSDPDAIALMMQPENSPFAVLGPSNAKYGNNVGFIENPKLRIGPLPEETLDGPFEWITERDVFFKDETRCLAYQMGYS